ncbi:MAG: holo-ACP synthase [Ketobacteraceae bacterium]|nr:holo-ACP synthase [Ketobacteraceae bacterium]
MILGIGTDIVSVPRMAGNIEKHGDAFAERVLAGCELEEYQQTRHKASYLAKRFAVKEAAAKALGTGFAEGVTWRHIFTDHDEQGKPLLVLTDEALRRARDMGVNRHHLSVSDEKEHAVAFVILEGAAV